MMRRVTTLFLLLLALGVKAQKVIPLYTGAAPGSENWTYSEKEMNVGDVQLVYNVSRPTLTAYLPDPAIATGTGIIVCPGGGFYILVMKSEGTGLVKYLNQKGIAVFILKYRLGQSLTDKPGEELTENMKKSDFPKKIASIIPLSVADGREAIKYVRSHAAEYNLSPSRIGIMGFSAGGTVSASTAFNYNADNRPDFVAPVYAYVPPTLQGAAVANDAPPIFLAAATDDPLVPASHSIDLYSRWLASKHSAELHLYAKGGHGFGVNKQNIPTDTWLDRFGDWLGLQGLLNPIDPKVIAHLEQLEKNRKIAAMPDWAAIKRYAKADSLVPAPAPGEKRVVFMGNSITDGWINADPQFFANKPYFDRGISGQTTGQMLVRFREDVINLKPEVVVILAGINDIAQNNGPSRLEDVFGNIVSMVELARANHIKVVLSSVLPAFNIPWRPVIDPKASVTVLNRMIKDYCDKNNIVYLDYFTVMADERRGLPPNLSKDGVHPTLDGYKMMEPLAEKAIEEAMKRKK
ncbi:MAG TPA: GDSL-type esterase/lipase family protein [Mucilaginibacter sp.]|jgi:acetyl esterase/lipase/lysophospholipase L1-like esterase